MEARAARTKQRLARTKKQHGCDDLRRTIGIERLVSASTMSFE
jgi:hypothetical protein